MSAGKVIVGVAVGLIMVGASLAMALNFPGMGKFTEVEAKNGVVTIPVAKVNDGKAHFFNVKVGAEDIKFFIVKAKDGSLKTAFDACEVCFEAKKGYEQDGEVMICKKCNKKFATDRIGPHSVGGCNPAPIASQIVNGNVVIKVEELAKGKKFFEEF
jgi:uncharacterized membrane protein